MIANRFPRGSTEGGFTLAFILQLLYRPLLLMLTRVPSMDLDRHNFVHYTFIHSFNSYLPTPSSTSFPISLIPPSLLSYPPQLVSLTCSPQIIKTTMNPNAKIEKNAAIPKHHPDPTFTIQSGTINGIVRVNANLYRTMIAALSLVWPLKHSMI